MQKMLSSNDHNSGLYPSQQIQPPFQKLSYTDAGPSHDIYATKFAAASGNTSSIIQKQHKNISKYKLATIPFLLGQKKTARKHHLHTSILQNQLIRGIKKLMLGRDMVAFFLIFKNYINVLYTYLCTNACLESTEAGTGHLISQNCSYRKL